MGHANTRRSDLWPTPAPDEFEVDVSYGTDVATLLVHGDLNSEAADELDGVLRAVAGVGRHRVVLDLAGVASIDAAVSGIIASSTAFVAANSRLTIRSASSEVRQVLDGARLSESVEFDASRLPPELGAEETPGDDSIPVSRPKSRTLDDLRSLDHHEASPAVLDAALRLVATVAARTVRGADGASITLRRDGTPMTVAATDHTIIAMDRDQYVTGQGPCVAAATECRWFHIESLTEETRWPAFVARARKHGIHSVLSTPIRGPWQPVGALNIYSNARRPFGPPEQALAALLASQASGIVADAGLGPFAVNLGSTSELASSPQV